MRAFPRSLVPLDFRSVPFRRRPVRAVSSGGTPYLRWVPYGMPQLGEYKWIMDTIVFLYPDAENARKGSEFGGTGFLIAIPSRVAPETYFHIHAVTNWHVACQGSSVIRINKRDGSSPEIFEYDPSEWTFDPGGCDVAISPPLQLDPAIHKAEAFGLDALLTTEEEQNEDISAAEDIFMLGRFVDFSGSETNIPAFRFGNISITHAEIKQPTRYVGRSIITDMHSRTGFSGSPVFVYRTPGSLFSPLLDLSVTWHYIKLIGILWGQFPEKWQVKESSVDVHSSAQASLIMDGKYVDGLSGMSCVVPSAEILNLLGHLDLRSMRNSIDASFTPELMRSAMSPRAMKNNRPEFSYSPQEQIQSEIDRKAFMSATIFG